MTKEDHENENSTKCEICDNAYIQGHVKVRDHYDITKSIETHISSIEINISRLN